MSLMEDFRERIGSGLGWGEFMDRLAGRDRLPEAFDLPRVDRAGEIVRRLAAGLPAGARVLEIAHAGDHRGWVGEGADYRCVEAGEGGRLSAELGGFDAGRFDFIFSVGAVEHMRAPWEMASEVTRLLVRGGVTFHSTCFSAEYRPSPGDFCRFTPDGLKALFPTLECLISEFDATARPGRRARSSDPRSAISGSREGWSVHYAGRSRR